MTAASCRASSASRSRTVGGGGHLRGQGHVGAMVPRLAGEQPAEELGELRIGDRASQELEPLAAPGLDQPHAEQRVEQARRLLGADGGHELRRVGARDLATERDAARARARRRPLEVLAAPRAPDGTAARAAPSDRGSGRAGSPPSRRPSSRSARGRRGCRRGAPGRAPARRRRWWRRGAACVDRRRVMYHQHATRPTALTALLPRD